MLFLFPAQLLSLYKPPYFLSFEVTCLMRTKSPYFITRLEVHSIYEETRIIWRIWIVSL